MKTGSPYDDAAFIADHVKDGRHRDIIGGLWEEIGPGQLEFLKGEGLKPHHRLLDIGCGCLRGGVHFVSYLDPGNYYGLDSNQTLLDAGFEIEIPANGLIGRLSKEHLRQSDRFELAAFDQKFDYGLAFSVFTHITLNAVRTCIENWSMAAAPGALLYATYFAAPSFEPTSLARTQPGAGIVTYGDRDPFHYRIEDLAFVGRQSGWRVSDVAAFSHPRGQRMARFEQI